MFYRHYMTNNFNQITQRLYQETQITYHLRLQLTQQKLHSSLQTLIQLLKTKYLLNSILNQKQRCYTYYSFTSMMKPPNISRQRILAEVKKLSNQKLSYLVAAPLTDDLYNWHFTFQGPENTEFHQGLYHGQILLPFQYPFKPPDIVFMNKNGRFQTNTKICLTITQYHPEEWNSAWTIRTMLQAVISLFAQNVQGVGSQASSADVRKFLAKKSHSFVCQKCGPIRQLLEPRAPSESPLQENNHPTSTNQPQESLVTQKKVEEENREANKMINFFNRVVNEQRKEAKQRRHLQKQKRPKVKRSLNAFEDSHNRRQVEYQNNERSRIERIEVEYDNQETNAIQWISKARQIAKNITQVDTVFKSIKWVD